MKRLWLVSYDIADDRRRRRVERLLLGLGDRVQESLFECPLRADQIEPLQKRLQRLCDAAADRVALLPLCRDCQASICGHGLGRDRQRGRPTWVVV